MASELTRSAPTQKRERRTFDHREDTYAYVMAGWANDMILDFEGITYGNLHSSACLNRVCLNPEHEGERPAIDVSAS